MKRKLPSLLAIRYFESVGRNMSFTVAANELSITQAAVSHQVRQLEEHIGHQLFTRLHHRIELTAKGQELLEACTECLDRLADVFERVGYARKSSPTVLSVTPLMSARWLLPKLNGYLADHPGADIVLHHSLKPPAADSDEYDLKIFYSAERLDDPRFDLLVTDHLVPLCSPSLTRGMPSVGPQEFRYFNLVHEFSHEWWAAWCRAAHLDPALAERGMVVDDPIVLEKAALIGHGLILGSLLFLDDKLQSGELIAPFGHTPAFEIYYYLFAGANTRPRAVEDLRRWIIDERSRSDATSDAT